MNNPDGLFAIVPITTPGSAPPDAIMVGGPLSQVMQCIPDTIARRDAIEGLEAQRITGDRIALMQDTSRTLQIAAFCESVNHITNRLDALEAKRERKLRKMRAAEDAEEQQNIRATLDAMPDPDNPEAPALYGPSGELHSVAATNPADNEGDLPEQLLKDVPPPTGNYPLDDPSELDEPSQQKFRNPAAISLNEADEYDY